jgi:hypothetical protein
VITGGTNLNHLFDFAQASTTDPSVPPGNLAVMYFAQPEPSQPTGTFPQGQESLATPFPNSAAPNMGPNPMVQLGANDVDLTNFIASQVPPTAAGFVNVYSIRLYTNSAAGNGTLGTGQYWDIDISVDPTAGTWEEVYPTQGSTGFTTTTGLTVSPQTKAAQGSPVTLTAQTAASDLTQPAGSVQFFQDGQSLGSSDVNSSGVATLTTSSLLPSAPAGTQLSATFTPTNTSYASSSGSAAYEVDPVPTTPTLSGPHQVGAKETCTEPGQLDFGVVASFTWKINNTTTIGTGHTLTVPGSAYKQSLTCTVSEHDGTGPTTSATSTPVTVILGAPLKATKRPTLSGTHRVGRIETVHAGTWSQKNARFTYQWLLNGRVIRGATHTTLRLTRTMRGKKISCRVTAHLAGFANGVATTASVRVS